MVPGCVLLLLVALALKGQAVGGEGAWSPQLAHAQSPILAIGKSASPDPVVAGEKLTYVITITNTQSTALTGIVVRDMVPEHTTFSSVNSRGGQWIMRSPGRGKRGEVSWEAVEPLLPDQTAHLEMVVQVEEGGGGLVINADYEATIEGVDEPVIGQPVTTHVVQPTPTVTPTSMPTATPMPPTFTPIPTVTPTPQPATLTPTPFPTSVPALKSPGSQMGYLLGTVSIVAVLVPVAAWFVKSKRTR
jgi:uncharacterized repeat protein (TIGR01451 family)